MVTNDDGTNRSSPPLGKANIREGMAGMVGARGGGMSTREKAKFKELEDTQKRVLTTQLRIDT